MTDDDLINCIAPYETPRYIDAMTSFHTLRGQAVDAFAELEQNLCGVLMFVKRTELEDAHKIFFGPRGTKERLAPITKAITDCYGSMYEKYWQSVVDAVVSINTRRNEIVHWCSYCEERDGVYVPYLINSNIRERFKGKAEGDWADELTGNDLRDFVDKTAALSNSLRRWSGVLLTPDIFFESYKEEFSRPL